MKNSKKFSNVAKKSLAVALAILSLTGSAQNVSAMKSVDQVQNNSGFLLLQLQIY